MTKIDIISGFLGAGKTTLIKKLIQESYQEEKVVLIENEFGEIGIDGSFLKDAGITIKEMNSGCICCSLVGDFSEALTKVLTEFTPDRIIIEPSGVGKLSDVIDAITNLHNPNLHINGLVSVVDGQKCRVYKKNFGEFFNNQIAYASTIIVTRTDKITEFQIEECITLLREINTQASVITTPITKLTGNDILHVIEEAPTLEKEILQETELCPTCGHHHHEHHHHGEHCNHDHNHDEHCNHDHDHDEHCHHDHHAHDIFTSIGFETPKHFNKEQLQEILHELSTSTKYGTVLRAKGILASADDTWLYFDLVPEEFEIRDGKADFTGQICVIGTSLNKKEIATVFGVKE